MYKLLDSQLERGMVTGEKEPRPSACTCGLCFIVDQCLLSPCPSPPQVEPFFVSLALYDANKGLKVSEDFHVDLNDFHLRSLLEKQSAKSLNSNNSSSTQQIGASGLEPKDQWPTLSQQVRTSCFNITFLEVWCRGRASLHYSGSHPLAPPTLRSSFR